MTFFKALRPLALDFLSTIVFLVIAAVTEDIRLAIIIGVATGLAEIAWQHWRGHRAGTMEWMSLILVAGSGAATLLTNDPRFVMLKPTFTYAVIGVVMLVPGWMLRYVPPEGLARVPRARFVMWGYVWSGLMFVSAALNLVLVFGLALDVASWGIAMTIWGLASKLSLFVVQYAMIRGEARRAALSNKGVPAPSSMSLVGPQ